MPVRDFQRRGYLRSSLRWDPTEPAQPELSSPEQGPFAHFSWAKQLTFASVFPAALNPCLAWTFQVQAALGHKLVGVRQSVIKDLQQLVSELQEDQDSALQALPAHVAAVYRQGSTDFKFQLLPLAWLLELCQFPGRNELLTELFWGFKLLGPVSRGSGWLNRDDTKYSRPLTQQDFRAANQLLAGQLRVPSAPSEHSDVMLAELYKERDLGRVQGPLPLELLGSQSQTPALQVARGFAVVQNDKVRRADDWLRSLHNSTIAAVDTPPYMGGPTVVGGALRCAEVFQEQVLLSAVDHEGAYRSLPVREPSECGLVMPGDPPTLWSHFALPFGSVGSVWGYLRVADVVAFLTITLLFVFAAHYVDDFFSLERSSTAALSFMMFQTFHRSLGFRMKEEKSKEPGASQTLLGIEWEINHKEILASPGVRRVARLTEVIDDYLEKGRMSSSECSQLTGKLCFTCTWVFGNIVSSAENIADGISRGDLQELRTVAGTFHEVSFKEVWPILRQFKPDYKNYEEEFDQLVLERILSEGYQQSVRSNAEVQWELLQSAWKLLRPGGTLVYSSCTLNSQENEAPCFRLLELDPSAEVVDLRHSLGMDATGTKEGFLRVWPQAFDTMGFFVACFRRQREPGSPGSYDQKLAVDWLRPMQAAEIRRMREGAEAAGVTWPISDPSERVIVSKDGAAFLLPRLEGLPHALLLRCPRPGLCVGPGHAELRLATATHLDTEEWAELNASQGGGLGAFGALMDLRARKGDVRGAEEVLVQIRQQRMKPDLISYNTLLKAYAAVKDCKGAMRILASMRSAAVLPDNASFSTAMQACVAAGRSKAAEQLLADLRSTRLQPDLMTCTTLIRSYAADSRRRDAEALLQQMELDTLQPDVACYTALMDLYASLRDRGAAEGLLNNMSVAPNVVTYGVLLKLYAAEADVERAEDTLRAMRRISLQPNFLCYTALLSAYAKKGDINRATGVAEELQSTRVQPDVVMQSSLILAHTRAGDLQGAEEVLRGMGAWGLLPNVVCFATLLDGYARTGDVPNAERVLGMLRGTRGLQANVVVASAMAKCRANAGDFAGATEELRRLPSAGLVPNQRSFAPVLAACARAGDAEAAARLRALASSQGLRLDSQCRSSSHMLAKEKKPLCAHERRLQPVKERTQPHFFIRLIYATRDGSNIFTPEYLKRIKHIEDRLETLPGYRRFCLADGNGRCVRPLSAVNYFFASMDASTGTITPNGRGEHLLPIQAILANLGTSNSYFVDRYFGVSSGQLKSALEGNITRSVLRFGLPLRGFQNTEDHRQAEMFGEFVRDQLRPYLIEASSEKLRVYFYGDQVTQLEVESAVWHDATYAIGSLLFIFVYLVFYLRSVVLTVMALFCIALSFPISFSEESCKLFRNSKTVKPSRASCWLGSSGHFSSPGSLALLRLPAQPWASRSLRGAFKAQRTKPRPARSAGQSASRCGGASDRRCTPSVPGVDEELATCDMWHALLSKEGYMRLNSFSGVRIRRWCSWRRQRQGTPPSAPAVWCSPDMEEDGDPWATPLPEYACYCFVYGHGKMIAINFLSFFVVLGVGADDVFVLHDVWVLSRRHGTGEMALARRLWSMYCKAGMAIFATSATTAASFFANLASSIGPLRQFGFFMGTCITVNWILVAVMYPLILVNYERSTCKGALIEAEQSSPMEEQLVDSCQGTDLDVEDGSGCSPGDVVRRASSKGTLGGGLAVKMLAFCVSFLGIGGSVYALHSAVRNLRPSNGLPKFFPEDSNLGGLQELQMRFGNETSIESTELKLCHGRAQDAKLVCDGKSGPTATVAPPTEPPPLHLPQDKDMEVPPLPHPPLTPKPSEKHPQPQPRPQPTLRPVAPSQRPSPSPAAAAPVAAKGFDLQLEVKGHSIADIQEFEDLVRDQIVESLRLSPEDLSFDIKKLKVLDGRRLQEGQYEVTLHFQHVTPEKEREIREYLRQHKDLLSLLGAEAPTPAQKPHPPQPQAPLHPPHASHASPQSPQPPITKLSSTRQPAATTSEPTRGPATSHPEAPHTRRTTVPPTQSKLTTLPSTVPATSTSAKLAPATTAVSSKLRPSTTSMTSSTAMQLHLQPRGMPHDRQAVIHVLLGVREVRGLGSAYTYELDESFDLSRREAQLAIVEFCQRLRQEARLKVVKGQWSCWPSKLKDFLLRRGEQFPTYAIWPAVESFLAQVRGEADHVGFAEDGSVSWVQLDYRVEFDIWSSGRQVQPYMDLWEDTAKRVFNEVTQKYRDDPAEVATFASKFLSESDAALDMAMAGLSAKQLLNSLQLGICVIDSCSVHKAAGEFRLSSSRIYERVLTFSVWPPSSLYRLYPIHCAVPRAEEDLGLRVILIVYDDDAEVESQSAGLLLHRASLDDGAEAERAVGREREEEPSQVVRVAAEYECAFAVPARAGEASWPWTLQMEYKHWVQAAASLCEVHFTVESSGNFNARLPEAMKKHLRKLRYQKHPEVSTTKQPQPQDFKEPLQWDAGQAFVVTVTRGERCEWLLCIGELEDAAILQEASHLAYYLLETHGADSWIEREDDPSISDALCEIGGLWGASRSTLLTAASGPHAGLRGLGIGSNKKLRQRAALLALAATAFAQWGSEEPLPGSAASLKTLATAVREKLQPEGKTGRGPNGTSSENCLGMPLPLSDLFQRAEAENRVVNSALSSWIVSVACALVALGAFTRSLWLSGIACFAMLSTAACSLFFITNIFQWRFGLMEAVSLIIFCGFSVDYPLHVVQAYVQERSKGSGVRRALREVGGAVASGCATTCGAAIQAPRCGGGMIALPPKVPPPLLTSGDEAEQDGANVEETAEVLAEEVTCIPVAAVSFAKLAEDLRQLQEQLVEAHAREVSLASGDGRRSSVLSVRSTASAPGISPSPCSAQSFATGQGKDRSSFSLKKDPDNSDFTPVSPVHAASSKGHSLLKRAQSGGPGERSTLMPRRPSRHEGADVDPNTEAPVALTVRKSLMVEDAKTMSRSVAEQARRLSNNLEEQVLEELENVPTSCQLRGEWGISDEDLVELKKRTIKCSPTKRSTGSAHWSYLPPSHRVYFHAGEVMLSEDAKPWILRPSSKPRLVWDVLALFVIVHDLVTVPLQVFELDAAFHETKRGLQLFTTVFWLLDIPTNFLTAVYINGALQVDPWKIAQAYSRSWLCFDVLVLIPDVMAIVEGAQDAAEGTESIGLLRAARTGRLLRLVRFLRILRLAKLLQVLGSLSARINHEMALLAFGITKMIFLTAYLGHLLSCLWFAVGDVEDGWVYTRGLNGAPFHLQYLTSLEWALSRIHPSAMQNNMALQTGPERALAIAASFLALGVSSLFISSITNTMADINRERQRKKQILYSVRDYCGSHRISSGHTLRIKQYVEREHHRKKTQQLHLELLETLPKDMLFELFHEGRSQALQHHSLFDRLGRIDPVMELNFCNKVLAELHVMTLDKVFKSEDAGKAMYIPAAGQYNYEYLPPDRRAGVPQTQAKQSTMRRLIHRLSLRSTESKVWPTEVTATITAVGPGDCLSEYCLWVEGWKHRGNLQAAVDGRLISVQVSEIGKFLQDFPGTLVDTVVYARFFLEALNRHLLLQHGIVTDLPLPSASEKEDASFSMLHALKSFQIVNPAEEALAQ
eukprot:s258_g5.t2